MFFYLESEDDDEEELEDEEDDYTLRASPWSFKDFNASEGWLNYPAFLIEGRFFFAYMLQHLIES